MALVGLLVFLLICVLYTNLIQFWHYRISLLEWVAYVITVAGRYLIHDFWHLFILVVRTLLLSYSLSSRPENLCRIAVGFGYSGKYGESCNILDLRSLDHAWFQAHSNSSYYRGACSHCTGIGTVWVLPYNVDVVCNNDKKIDGNNPVRFPDIDFEISE